MAGASIKIGASSSEFQKQMKEVTNQLKLVSSECSVATEKARLFGNTQDKLSAIQKELTSKLQAQNQIVKIYKDRITVINGEIEKQKSKQAELNKKIEDATKRYKDSVEATGKNSEESKKLKSELQNLKEEYAKNEKAIESNNNKLIAATTKMNNTEKAILQNQSALEEINKSLKNIKIDEVAEKFDKAGDKIKSLGTAMSTRVTAPIIALGTASVASFNLVDDGMDKIIAATGATGEKALELQEVYENVASNIPASFDEIGGAIGELNTRFSFTGDILEKSSEDFLKFARINGVDVTESVRLVSRAMGDAGIPAENYNELLDQLTKAAQDSGVSINGLTENIAKYGAPMRALGFDTKESIALFAGWEKAGVNTEIAFSGMKKAISNWGAEGKDSREEFKKTLSEIEETPDIAAATTKAIEVFGAKAGPDLADAIKGGRFEYQTFIDALDSSTGVVENTYGEIVDGGDDAKVAMNNLNLAMSGLGELIMQALAPILQKITLILKDVTARFKGLNDNTKSALLVFGGIAAATGPAMVALGAVSKGISNTVKGFKDIRDFGSKAIGVVKDFGPKALSGAKAAGQFALNLGKTAVGFAQNAIQSGVAATKLVAHKVATIASSVATNTMAAAQAALNFVMALNPITLIIIGITALIAAIVLLWNKCEWFRNLCLGLFEAIKAGWNTSIEFLKNNWKLFVEGFKVVWNSAIESVKLAWQGFKITFDLIVNLIKSIWQNIVNGILNACISTVEGIKNAWNGFKNIFEAVGNAIKALWEVTINVILVEWKFIVSGIKLVWEGFKNIFQNIVNIINLIWESAINGIFISWNFIVSAIKLAWEGFKIVFEGVGSAIKFIWQGIGNIISNTWDKIVGGVKSAWQGIISPFEAVAKAIGNIWEGVKAMFKLPHFTITGTLNPLKWESEGIPKIGVDWYYKGGIFKTPTVLGNIGVGDAFNGQGSKAEAVVPLDEMYSKISDMINSSNSNKSNVNLVINSPKALSPGESAKEIKRAYREMGYSF